MPTVTAETAEDVSKIAFGFMASKALFAALHVDLFSHLSDDSKTEGELSGAAGIPLNRVITLTTALRGIGLMVREGGKLTNAPAAEAFLVKGAKYDFGDYLRYQIDGQMYPVLQQLNSAVDGTLDPDDIASYASWMSDPEQARIYSRAQHAGSLGPGRTIARLVDLSDAKSLLDVGGGTGAMTICLCKENPELGATIIDFPQCLGNRLGIYHRGGLGRPGPLYPRQRPGVRVARRALRHSDVLSVQRRARTVHSIIDQRCLPQAPSRRHFDGA